MTESQIEAKAERMMDRTDEAYLEGRLTQDEYEGEVRNIKAWVSRQEVTTRTPYYL